MFDSGETQTGFFAVIPLLIGPLQLILALLPALLAAVGMTVLSILRPKSFQVTVRLLWRLKFSLLIVALFGVASATALQRLSRSPAERQSLRRETAPQWPSFRGGNRRTGAREGEAVLVKNIVNWTFDSESKAFYSSPAFVSEWIIGISADKGVFSDRGAIFCLNARTGELNWKSVPERYRATFSSPAVSGRYLVCGEGLHDTTDGRIICLDLYRSGKVLWEFRTHGHVESSPCLYRGRVYVGAGDDGFYCLSLNPSKAGKPQVVWHATGPGFPDADSPPLAENGRIFVGLGIDGKALVCLDADTGQVLWRCPTPYPVFAPPTIANGKVFVGMGNGNFIESEEEALAKEATLSQASRSDAQPGKDPKEALKPGGGICCIDSLTGRMLWQFSLKRSVLGAIAACNDGLYFGSRDGFVYHLSHEGKELRHWNARAPILASPAVTDQHVYIVSEKGAVFALERQSLQPIWTMQLGGGGPFLSSPTVAAGRLYVGTPNRGLVCIGDSAREDDKENERLAVAEELIGLSADPAVPRRIPKWTSFPGDIGEPDLSITGTPAACADLVVVAARRSGSNGVLALKGTNFPQIAWFHNVDHDISSAVELTPMRVVFVEGVHGQSGRYVHCVRTSDGTPNWKLAITPDASGNLLAEADCLFIQDNNADLALISSTGSTLWRQRLGTLQGAPHSCGSILMVACPSPPSLRALDKLTGQTLWTAETDSQTEPVLSGNVVYYGTTRGVAAHSLITGNQLWQADTGPAATSPSVCGGILGYVNASSEMILVDAHSGILKARVPDTLTVAPVLTRQESTLYASNLGVMTYDFATRHSRMTLSTAGYGRISSQLVLGQSGLYCTTDRHLLLHAGYDK